ncbi:phosphatase 2C-like domain-containing protein [Ochromonadaceae sp. CCMP2298]|nr:phosphatase 2C-like domain-containing protein [Ochromonadaceae sp. CCMP2298]
MGCSGSNQRLPDVATQRKNPLTPSEIDQRIEHSKRSIEFSMGGVSYRYAYVSQRGYYPGALNKENQDAFFAAPVFGNHGANQAFFGVFDGHGKDGHQCARFAEANLSREILAALDRLSSTGATTAAAVVMQALVAAHLRTNELMHAQTSFEDALSGTTSISVLIKDRTLFVSNVGDSRAIIISTAADGRLVARALSSDQTPYREDERARCKKTGARVLSYDQIEGLEPIHENWGNLTLGEEIDEGGDPPRIWSPMGDYPGSAFTRSFGDRVAEECGVFAEPEISQSTLTPNDKFLIIASDGVFEFLTNQMVADEVATHSDPLAACQKVVKLAYHLWLQYEVRTDDITMIAIFLDDVEEGVPVDTSSFVCEKGGAVADPVVTLGKIGATPDSIENLPPPPPTLISTDTPPIFGVRLRSSP